MIGVAKIKAAVRWSPIQLSSLLAWYDPSDIATISPPGGPVSQLNDKSINGYHLVQGTLANRPATGTRTQNLLNVLDCDGTDFMVYGSFPVPSSGDIAIFVVAILDSINNTADSVFSMNATSDFQLDSNSTTQFDGRINVATIGSSVNLTGGPFPGPSIYNCNFDFSGLGIYNAFIDGTQRAVNTTYSSKLGASQDFRVLCNRGANQPINGAFGEVVLCEDVTAATRYLIEGYLAWKWGIQANLPGGHPYASSPP